MFSDIKMQVNNSWYVAKQDNTRIDKRLPLERYYKQDVKEAENTKITLNNFINEQKQLRMEKDKKFIVNLISLDSNAPKDIDKELIASAIVKYSNEVGIDPLIIASIIKQESHFNQNVPHSSGSGIMQLTSITIKDMFQRPKLYGETIKPVLEKYGTPQNLMTAIREDAELNIKLGTLVYKEKLRVAKGNEHKALELYNGSDNKKQYANEVKEKIAQANLYASRFEYMA